MSALDELLEIAYDVEFFTHPDREYPIVCRVWFRWNGKRLPTCGVGKDAQDAMERTLEEIAVIKEG